MQQFFNRLTTMLMIFLITMSMCWLPLITSDNGFSVFESMSSKIYLENYDKEFMVNVSLITGNVWSFFNMIKNGNLVSLIIFGLCNIIVIFSLRTMTKKRFFKNLLWIFLSLTIFGISTNRLHTIHSLILIFMGLLYNEF